MWRTVVGFAAVIGLGLSVKGYFLQRKDLEGFGILAAAVGSGLLVAFAAGYVAGRVLRRHVMPAVPGYSLTGSRSSSKPPAWVYALPLVGALAPVGMQLLARSSPQAADWAALVAVAVATVFLGFAAANLPWPPSANDPQP